MTEALQRLSNATLSQHRQNAGVTVPAYDRSQVKPGIVHLGIGAFHRAHQAAYTDSVLNRGDHDWGIIGVSLRRSDTRDALDPQDNLYTLAIRDGNGEKLRVIGSIVETLVAPENPEAVLAAMTAPETRIISLTVTEKGYCYAPAMATLEVGHPDIVHDLENPAHPRSAPGYIVEAIRRRRAGNIAPFTLLSCDNLPSNGETLRRVIVRMAELSDPALARYIEQNIAFPSTMIDRIVPATTDKERASISAALGLEDRWPIATEPFTQWVIEDHFANGRPAWELAGATFVEDVAAFELMKLRLLNGSHSTLAYLGYLAGHETVSDAMAAPGFKTLIRDLMDQEVTPTLPTLAGFDVTSYKDQLIARFQNPALHHRTWQIAMDGSQKLPQRLLNTIEQRLAAGQSIDRLALGVAAWMRYVTGTDERGQPIDVRDPLAQQLLAATQNRHSADSIIQALLGFDTILKPAFAQNQKFLTPVRTALASLLEIGAGATALKFSRGEF